MAQWYLGKIAHYVEQENGSVKAMLDTHLLKALSYTDGEAMMYKIAEEEKLNDWCLKTLAPIKLHDVFIHYGENFYIVKVVYFSLNERTGKEKRIVNQILVNADDLGQAIENININLKNMLIPYVIEAVKLMSILEIHTPETNADTSEN
ncbi:MAG: DUF4494 domain-containing protein [Runella slithyformis]|nr:MAG: DUF4494 domain-containing protein [Runella slithyformis]